MLNQYVSIGSVHNMFAKPQNGWVHAEINGVYIYNISYLTDVPYDMLHAFRELLEHGIGCVRFDHEGAGSLLIFSEYDGVLWIRDSSDENMRHVIEDFGEIGGRKMLLLVAECCDDFEREIGAWSKWTNTDDSEDPSKTEIECLSSEIAMVRALLAKEGL